MKELLRLTDHQENLEKTLEHKEEEEYYYKLWEDDRL